MRKRPTLTGEFLAWIFGTLVVLWGAFIAVGYKTGEHEADELTDGHLASVASLLVNLQSVQFIPGAVRQIAAEPELRAHDYQQSMNIVVWNAQGQLLSKIGEAPTPVFAREEGFTTLSMGQPAVKWRAFSKWNAARNTKIMVLLSLQERDDLAQDIAEQITEPGLWVLPVLLLTLGIAVRRGLRPLYNLSQEVHKLDISQPRALEIAHRHEEFRASIEAINTLVQRYQASLTRERELADEFAHELRTPLTSLALQVRALRDAPHATWPADALKRLERDVFRASEVLTHLLALARASRATMNEAMQTFDLVVIAQQTLAEFAPTAYASGHELLLVGEQQLIIKGHPVLLAIALRNLLENATSHTPAGSSVQVQLLAQPLCLQVCDASPANAMQAQTNTSIPTALGLGLGHMVVQKVAEAHGATFEKVAAPAGFTSCYRLCFEDPAKLAERE